jgi:hypothetical protein
MEDGSLVQENAKKEYEIKKKHILNLNKFYDKVVEEEKKEEKKEKNTNK